MPTTAAQVKPTRQDTWRVTAEAIDPDTKAKVDLGVWDKKSGGSIDTDMYKYKPGSMQPQLSLGGTPTYDDITVERLYTHERDHILAARFIKWTGRATISIFQMPMDIDGNISSAEKPIVYIGKLKTYNIPDHDSESTDPAMISIVVSPDGAPTA